MPFDEIDDALRRQPMWEPPAGFSRQVAAIAVRLPAQSPDRATNDHIFHLIFPSEEARDACQGALRREGIGATFHYVPLHSSPFGRRLPGTRGAFPVSERIAGGLLRLPMHPLLEDADVDRVIEAVTARPA